VTLVKSPEDLTILEVVNAVEPIQRIRSVSIGPGGARSAPLPLHRRLDNALAMVEKAFAATTLAEVLSEPTKSVPLLSISERPDRSPVTNVETAHKITSCALLGKILANVRCNLGFVSLSAVCNSATRSPSVLLSIRFFQFQLCFTGSKDQSCVSIANARDDLVRSIC
jgi:hypothetical protein